MDNKTKTIKTFSHRAEYKINMQTAKAFVYTNNIHIEDTMKENYT